MPHDDVGHAKQAARYRIWSLLERIGTSPRGAHGNIPWFAGSDRTAARLGALDVWLRSRVVMSNPDRVQHPVRRLALRDGKLLYVAVPGIATPRPFYRLDPTVLAVPFDEAATIDGADRAAPTVGADDMRPIDVVVAGSVVVNRGGTRVGKGAGYSDIEVAHFIEAGLVTDDTVIVTTVHDLQVVDDELPESDHDFGVDIVVTPSRVIPCPAPRRPAGIIASRLTEEQVSAMPFLRRRGRDRTTGGAGTEPTGGR